MKTNEQKAAKFGYYNLNSLQAEVLNNDYFNTRIEDYKQLIDGVKIPEGLKNAEAYFLVDKETQQDGTIIYFARSVSILVFSDKTDIPMLLRQHKKQYYLHPVYEAYIKEWNSTNYEQRRPYMDSLKEPNYIGKFTDKKISDWIDYGLEYLDALKKCYYDICCKAGENRIYIDKVISFFNSRGAKIHSHGTLVYIEDSYFNIKLELLDNGAYLSKKVEYRGSIEDVMKIFES